MANDKRQSEIEIWGNEEMKKELSPQIFATLQTVSLYHSYSKAEIVNSITNQRPLRACIEAKLSICISADAAVTQNCRCVCVNEYMAKQMWSKLLCIERLAVDDELRIATSARNTLASFIKPEYTCVAQETAYSQCMYLW